MRFAVILCLALVFPMKTLADIKSCQRLYSSGPRVLNGMKLSSTHDYESVSKGSGYGLQYGQDPSDRISLIFFDSGEKEIPHDYAIQHLVDSTKFIISLKEGEGHTEGNVNITAENLPVRGDPAAAILHIGPSEQMLGNEYLLMGVIDNCMYKFRYTTNGSNNQADTKFQDAIRDLGIHFDQNS